MIYVIPLFLKFFHVSCRYIFIYLRLGLYICMMVLNISFIWLYSILVKLSGDVGENPDPKPKSSQRFSICHWNVNSVSAHNFSKVSLLRTYISIHKSDAICISETFFDSDTAFDVGNSKIEGYDIVRYYQPSNSRRGQYIL